MRIAQPPTIVYADEITGAQTTHYTLEVDLPSKAVSFAEAEQMRKRKGGAFLRHRKSGNFILALESGRHTDPATGNSYRTFAIWKPEAPHANYIHDAELNEKYKAVATERARDRWPQKHSTIPPIETLETHIISGAIIPLGQRLKTNEDACLRVVRVITEEGQRIVGIQIPPDSVGTVLRSLGLSRDLREPEEIFYAVLDEGDEITLASNLTLRRGSIHSEPAIELCGADPYKFAELRELGLINEQISWKQRFFVPSDETSGIEILTSLLDRYPVIDREERANEIGSQVSERIPAPAIEATNTIDINEWILAPAFNNLANELDTVADQTSLDDSEVSAIISLTRQVASIPCVEIAQRSAAQLAFSFQ